MPDPALLTPLGREMLEDRPLVLRDDPDVIAITHCQAKETERMFARLEEVRAQAFPQHATAMGLRWWESLLRTTVAPAGWTVEQRRDLILAMLRKLKKTPTGLVWEQRVTDLVGPGWSYREHLPEALRRVNLAPNPKAGAGTTTNVVGTGLTALTAVTLGAGGAPAPSAEMEELGLTTAFHATSDGVPDLMAFEIPMEADDDFVLSAWVWVEAASTAQIRLAARAVTGGTLYQTDPLTEGAWQRVFVPYTTTVAENWRLALYQATVGTADFYATGFLIERGTTLEDYVDGDTDLYEWLGDAEESASSQTSQPPAYTLLIELPFPADSELYTLTERVLRNITPAHLDLVVVSSGGFVLDQSQLDQQAFTE